MHCIDININAFDNGMHCIDINAYHCGLHCINTNAYHSGLHCIILIVYRYGLHFIVIRKPFWLFWFGFVWFTCHINIFQAYEAADYGIHYPTKLI